MPLRKHRGLHVFCFNENIVAQSNNTESIVEGGKRNNDVIINNVVCDEAKTTCFVEDESLVKSTFKMDKINNDYEVRFETIKDFLGKPYLLNSLQWSSASAENSNIYNFDIGPLLTSVVPWADKIRGFELIRGTFNLRVQVNCSPFQAGRLIIHYLPNYADRISIDATYAARYNSHLIQKFQHPHIDLDARDAVALISIPYISPSPYFDVKEGKYDWGRVFVDVVSPFITGATGISNAEVTFFGYWSDIELSAPIRPQSNNSEIHSIVPQSNNKQKFFTIKGKSLEEKEFVLGPISHGLKTVSSAASTLASIPMISSIMTTLSWAADVGSRVASIFGWSKPRANEHTTIVTSQPGRYIGTADGTDISIPTSLIAQNSIKMTDQYSIRSDDEMSLKFLLSVPTYTERITWNTSQASGSSLLNNDIRPQLLNKQVNTTVGLNVHTARYGAPLYYLSNFFNLWKGSMKIHIKIVKTMFHSGKLLITFTPITSTLISPGVTDSIYSLREIVDVREQSEITLNLPYMLHRPYLDKNQNMGRLNIYVLNDLRCPETVAQSIDLLIFYQAGDDFEFQAPGPVSTVGGGIYTPQSDNTETLVDAGIANSSIKPCTTENSELSIGEHFLSIKQLLNKNSPLQNIIGYAYGTQGWSLFPWFTSGITNVPVTGALRTSTYSADSFSFLAPLFQFYRGKARVLLATDIGANVYASNSCDAFQSASSQNYFMSGASFGLNTTIIAGQTTNRLPTQTPIPSAQNFGLNFVHIPYYCKYPVSFVQVWSGGTTNFYTDETQPLTSATFTCLTALGSTTTVQRSFCDDFQLTYFIGCPGLYLSSS